MRSKWHPIREGKNRLFILNQPQRFAIHLLDHRELMWEPSPRDITWCPRYLHPSHSKYRDQCYLCEYAELTNNRPMKASIRFAWPVWDILADDPPLEWLQGGMVLTEEIGDYLGLKAAATITIISEGRGMKTKRRVGIDVGPYDYPNTNVPIGEVDVAILSEQDMKKLFADPYSLDYPAELVYFTPRTPRPAVVSRRANDEALWAARKRL